MNGTFNFRPNSVEVINAPPWSISTLKEVAPKLGETIRILASSSSSAEEARTAVATVKPQVQRAVQGLPLSLSKKIINALELSPGESPVGWRKRVGLILAVVFFLALNYSGMKSNVFEMIDDAGQLTDWVSEHAPEVPDWFDHMAQWLGEENEEPS